MLKHMHVKHHVNKSAIIYRVVQQGVITMSKNDIPCIKQ